MKTSTVLRRTLLSGVACLLPLPLLAQTPQLPGGAVASGGGISTAGAYTLTGTIGQPNVTRLHSRDFTLDGGRWSLIAAIQDEGAPPLSVRYSSTNAVIVSWPVGWPGFALSENPDLTTTNWSKVGTPPTELRTARDTVLKQVILPRPEGNRFYRLLKQ